MCFHVFSFSNNNTKSCTANDFLPYKHTVPLHVIIKLCWMKWAWVLMPVSPEFKSYFCQLLSTWTWSKLPKFFEPKLLHLQYENNTSLLSCCEEILGWCRILGPLDFPGGSPVKNLPTMQEMRVWSLGWKYPLAKEVATHSSILAWEIPWTEEPGGLQSIGSQKSQTQLSSSTARHLVSGTKQCSKRQLLLSLIILSFFLS